MEIDQPDVPNGGGTEGPTSSSGISNCNEQHGNPSLKNDDNHHVYRQDIVRCKDGSMIGIVTEVAGDSDSESDLTDDEDDENGNENDKEEEKGNEEDKEGEEEGVEEEDTEEEDGNVENDGNEGSDDNSQRNEKRGPLTEDQVRVQWLNDSETTHSQSELMVVDRGFLHGDYVASASDPTGQVGLVVDVDIHVDLQAPDGSIVKDVSSKDLKRVRDITVGDFVVFGSWLGRVEDVLDNVTVLFDDGSVCRVSKADPLRLKPVAKNFLEDGHCPYHPGQRVKARSSVFKNARWLSGAWKANRVEGTVIKVTVSSVYVHWIASAGYGPESSTSPPEEQNPKNLKLLSCFTHATWQLGDWCVLPSLALSSSIPLDKGLFRLQLQQSDSRLKQFDQEEVKLQESNEHVEPMDLDCVDTPNTVDEDSQSNASPKSSSCGSSVSIAKDNNGHESWHAHRKKLRKVVVKRDKKARKKEESFERALLIVSTRTTVDVAWQDGTIQRVINSTSLIPIESPGDHDFASEEYVVEKAADDSDETSEMRRVGVVKSVNAKEKTACVRWLKQVDRPEDPREFEKEEIVSVYELEGHPDYDYCYGDVVVKLSSVTLAGDWSSFELGENQVPSNASTNNVKQGLSRKSDSKKGDVSGEVCSDELSDLSWVGHITGLKNGDIEVNWADGTISTVGPQEVYVVGRDDDASIVAGSEISDDAASWETVEDDERDTLNNADKEAPPESADVSVDAIEDVMDGEHNSGPHRPLALPLACIDFVTKIASGIFSRGNRHGDLSGEKELLLQEAEDIHMSEGSTSSKMSTSQDFGIVDIVKGETNLGKEAQEPPADVESAKLIDIADAEDLPDLRPNGLDPVICCDDNTCSFKRFDTAKDPLDHFFLEGSTPVNNARKWLKKVQRDWSILQNNLPDGIYVRVYEDRMDLLRAVIVGAYGTPYQDGLFWFDIQLPPEYPDVPPSVHYHSGGWKINPNLYEEGKVCLSLLNTWTGRGNEVWDPESSSILQVLVSLQGLVLNSRPYFNEAGYDKQVGTVEGEKNSLSYNENTFLLNCKTIMFLIRKPPKDFEDLVKEHFKQRGYYILKACDAYMKGYLIGSLAKDALVTDKSEANATSVGFKLMLAKIVPKLISSLSDVGADCQEFRHLLQL